MTDFWKILAISPTDDVKQIKRAYAAKLKQVRPDDDPNGFQELRQAYEWALEYGVRWFAHVDEDEQEEDFFGDSELEPEQAQPEAASVSQLEQHVVPFVPSYRRKAEDLNAGSPEPEQGAPHESLSEQASFAPAEPVPEPLVEPAPSISPIPQTVRVAGELLPTLRPLDEFFQAFYQHSAQTLSQAEVVQWLLEQPEWVSLSYRPKFEAGFQQSLTQTHWPWPAVLAVSQLLEWESLGAGRRDLVAVRRARLQARASLTKKPRWFNAYSKSAVAYALLRPPTRGWQLARPFLPISHWVKSLFTEVESEGFAADEIFDVRQVTTERALQSDYLNANNVLRLLILCATLFVCSAAVLSYEDGVSGIFTAAIISVALYALTSLSKFRRSYWRALWTRSLNRARQFPPLMLSLPVALGIAFALSRLDSPLLSLFLACFVLFCMRASMKFAVVIAVSITILLVPLSVVVWPVADQVLHGMSAFAIGLFAAAPILWYRIRKSGIAAHFRVEFTPWVRSSDGSSLGSSAWYWWLIIGFILLRAISSING